MLARFLTAAGAPLHLADDRVGTQHRSGGSHARASEAAPSRPNIVFVLTDDLSMDLLPYMPHVLAMEQRGLTFTNYFVTDSLCCPSRASIFTGDFPHDTGVFSNTGADGGFETFHDRGEEQHTFALALQNAGYRTALMGKYLNDYLQVPPLVGHRRDATCRPAGPSGTSPAAATASTTTTSTRTARSGTTATRRRDYLTDVLARQGGAASSTRGASTGKPFFLEVATFAPHSPYTPAPRDAASFPGLRAPRPPSFDAAADRRAAAGWPRTRR